MLIEFKNIKKYGIIPRGVIHVGMHRGEEYPIYKKEGVKTILFIEANKELAYAWNVVDEDCHVVHAAVSDKVEEVEFHITNNMESSSILELGDHSRIYPNIVNTHSVKMRTVPLKMIHEKIGIGEDKFNIINLDIQGAELKALRGIGDWRYLEVVYTEVNYREMYKGCALESEITEFLREKGFKKVEEADTGCGWGDALYVKCPHRDIKGFDVDI